MASTYVCWINNYIQKYMEIQSELLITNPLGIKNLFTIHRLILNELDLIEIPCGVLNRDDSVSS